MVCHKSVSDDFTKHVTMRLQGYQSLSLLVLLAVLHKVILEDLSNQSHWVLRRNGVRADCLVCEVSRLVTSFDDVLDV